MKKIFYVISLFLLLAFSANAQTHVIGFYNLENLFDIYDDPAKNDNEYLPNGGNKWTQEKYEKKVHNMARVIRAMRDDNKMWHTILGVSEIENRLVLEDLVADPQIAEANFQIVHYDGPDRRGVDVALLYDPKRFTYLDSESIPFDFHSDIDFSDTDTSYFRTRDILMVHGLIGGEDFAFYVTHLPSRIGGKGGNLRSRGAEIIYNHSRLMEAKYPGIKIAVMGDMNDNPTDESMVVYLHGKEKPEEVTPDDFFDPFIKLIKDGYGSLAYQGVWNIFDIVHVNYNLLNAPNGGYKLKPIKLGGKKGYYARVFHKDFMTQQTGQYKGTPFRTFSGGSFIGGYSDHYPTYIIIKK